MASKLASNEAMLVGCYGVRSSNGVVLTFVIHESTFANISAQLPGLGQAQRQARSQVHETRVDSVALCGKVWC